MVDQNAFRILPASSERTANLSVTLQSSGNYIVKTEDVVSDLPSMRSDDPTKQPVYALSSVLSDKWRRCVKFGRTEAIYKRESGRIHFVSEQSSSQNVTTTEGRLFTEYHEGVREEDLQPFSIYKIAPIAEG